MAQDFSELSSPDAAWGEAASKLSAFEIDSSVVLRGTALSQTIADLERRKIALGVGIAPLSGGESGCGYHVEGYSADGEPKAVAERLKRVGGKPRYFGFDEPMHFGHTFINDGKGVGCRRSIEDVAKDVAVKVKQIRAVFPDAQFGDVEPYRNDDAWRADVQVWIDAFRAETETNLAFFRLDMAWHLPWRDKLPALVAMLRSKGVPLQVIYNGDDQLTSDEAWIASAVRHFQEFEALAKPDVAVFQFWRQHPSHLLPETDNLTATWLINRYAEWRQTQP
jgi:hypothetical protein